ncbi:MAG: hypothetical protein M1828_002415 [Chrysothrix sp. TS-e1954]|nr:MAG: hypothetical protein M1828_002415 [Chrysothrix sp. TS-e1954]
MFDAITSRSKPQGSMQSLDQSSAQIAQNITGAASLKRTPAKEEYYTNNEGIPWPDHGHSKNVGGIPVVSDTFLLQRQQTFNRSKNLERMVHPCGSGAFGYFETTKDVSGLTKADFLQGVGQKTPIFIRFSTVTVGREFPDSARNPRGFAIKFYTGEGNYDIVGLNWPIFFCRDPIQGPDVIRSQARNPQSFLFPDYNAVFDFLGNVPESNHAGIMFFSNHGTPDTWRHEHGYGCHTFKWVNKSGEFVYIKYHFLVKHGQKQLTEEQATKISGMDPDYSKRDLWQAMEKGEEVEWKAMVQVMNVEDADPAKLGFDPFDVTKVWPRTKFPMQEFGKLVLNKNPEDYHRDVEQAAFSPGSMVPGIEDSPDALLQFRMFFYRDAQYHRIGVNMHQVPVNCPFMAGTVNSMNYDGQLRGDANHDGKPSYVPNSTMHKYRPDVAEAPYKVADSTVSRKSHYYHEAKQTEYDQARELYRRVMSDDARSHLHRNTSVWLSNVTDKAIQIRYLAQLYNIAPEYAQSVYDRLSQQPFAFSEVEKAADGAEKICTAEKLRPSQPTDKLVGFKPSQAVYNV